MIVFHSKEGRRQEIVRPIAQSMANIRDQFLGDVDDQQRAKLNHRAHECGHNEAVKAIYSYESYVITDFLKPLRGGALLYTLLLSSK